MLPSDQDATGRTLGAEELLLLGEVIASGTLTSTKGVQVANLEKAFADVIGTAHVIACSSGSAAVHAALAALDPEPGSEVITTGITDMGAIAPILHQGAIPVFADVDPTSGNVTAATIADRITERTRVIVATHLFGNPCDMGAIRALADERGIAVVEDAAQALLASHQGRTIGTWGDVGAFSLQQGKHITCGEGGLVVTDDAALARRIRLWVNKGWPYGEADPDHEFLAPNARLTELQGAVASAQLSKLPGGVQRRIERASQLTELLADVDGLGLPAAAPGDVHSYWRYCLRVDPRIVAGGPDAVATALRAFDIPSAPRYIKKPAFQCRVIAEQRTFGESRYPFTLADPEAVDYRPERFPGTFSILEQALVLPWNEQLTERHIDAIGDAIRTAVKDLA